MRIYCHSASENLTDREPHGEGLNALPFIRAMCGKGHEVFAFTGRAALDSSPSGLRLIEFRPSAISRKFSHSLRAFEYGWQSNRTYRRLAKVIGPFDAVWRMHPYHRACAVAPATDGRPLVVGPITDSWPQTRPGPVLAGKPRYGVSLGPIVRPLTERGWRETMRQASAVVLSKHGLIDKLPPVGKHAIVTVLPMIVELPPGLYVTRPGRNAGSDKEVQLVFIGGLRANKRPLVICEAVGLLRRKGIDARLTVCGDGPLRAEMLRVATEGGWRDALNLRGNIPNLEVYEVLAHSDLLLSSAIGEPYGRNIVEAMTVGIPVLAHRSGGPLEIIRHDVDGWLVEESTPEAFAAAVPLVMQPTQWHRLSEAARDKSKQWRPEIVGGKFEQVFQQVTENRRRRRHRVVTSGNASSGMNIFVHSASECLTDHLPHGEGLICQSLLRVLLDRGHSIWATTKLHAMENKHPRMEVMEVVPRAPAHTLHSFEYNLRINTVFRRWLSQGVRFDLVWRQAPFGIDCPIPPALEGLPLAVGPIFYQWPNSVPTPSRFGLSIRPMLAPVADLGWRRTLQKASLILGSTPDHARKLQAQVAYKGNCPPIFADVPVIASPPARLAAGPRSRSIPAMRLAFVAGLRDNKQPLIACEAVGLLRRKGIDAQITFCGDGPLADALAQMAAEGGWRDALDLRGNIPNAEVYEVLAQSDLLLSVAVGEPYGRNIAEAMSVGTPVIAHRSGGPAEIISHDVDGWLVAESTPEAFAAAVSQTLEPGRWERLSAAARATAQQWRPEVIGEKLERLFLETIARHSCGSSSRFSY